VHALFVQLNVACGEVIAGSKLHFWLHAPQLSMSLAMWVSHETPSPSQSAKPGIAAPQSIAVHTPPAQPNLEQVTLQPPQLLSVSSGVSQPSPALRLQSSYPGLQLAIVH
jgi:hypothetical protein